MIKEQHKTGDNMLSFTTTKAQLMSLQLGLREFGLQPVDWRIIKRTKSKFVIQSAHESDLYFIGEVKNDNLKQWKYIQLAGLY